MSTSILGSGQLATNQALTQTNTLNQEEFLKVLLAQLRFQDPMKPMDNQQFLAQMAQFSSLEQTRQLGERIDQLLTIQASTQSIGLLGKTVEVVNGGAASIGVVTTLAFKDGQPALTVKTASGDFLTDLALSQISLVRN